MANPLEIAIRIFTTGTADVRSDVQGLAGDTARLDKELDEAARSATDLDKALGGLGDKNGLGDVARDADDVSESVRRIDMQEAFGNLSEIGSKMSEIGASASEMAEGWIATAEEGRGIEQRLESILKAQNRLKDMDAIDDSVQRVTVEGHFDDDDEIRNSAILLASYSVQTEHMNKLLEVGARQARTMGQSLDSTANSFGKAYNTGNIAMLAKSGVTMSKQEIAAVKAAYGVSKLSGQMKFMEVVTKAVESNTASLNDSLTETQARANDVARNWDDAQTSLGTGAAEAKANMQSIVLSIGELANASPQMLEAAGGMVYYGGATLTASGNAVQLAGSLGSAALAAQTFGITGAGAMTAVSAAAVPLLATLTTIIATMKAIEWSRKAMEKSDEEMQNGTNQEKFVYRQANDWSNIWERLNPNIRRGESAEEAAVAGFQGRERARARQSRNPDGSTRVTFDPVTIKTPRPSRGFGS
jgi:hypothetical protein